MGFIAIEAPYSWGDWGPYDGIDGCNVWISVDGGRAFNVAYPSNPEYNCQIDLDRTGIIDGDDLSIIGANFGKSL